MLFARRLCHFVACAWRVVPGRVSPPPIPPLKRYEAFVYVIRRLFHQHQRGMAALPSIEYTARSNSMAPVCVFDLLLADAVPFLSLISACRYTGWLFLALCGHGHVLLSFRHRQGRCVGQGGEGLVEQWGGEVVGRRRGGDWMRRQEDVARRRVHHEMKLSSRGFSCPGRSGVGGEEGGVHAHPPLVLFRYGQCDGVQSAPARRQRSNPIRVPFVLIFCTSEPRHVRTLRVMHFCRLHLSAACATPWRRGSIGIM